MPQLIFVYSSDSVSHVHAFWVTYVAFPFHAFSKLSDSHLVYFVPAGGAVLRAARLVMNRALFMTITDE